MALRDEQGNKGQLGFWDELYRDWFTWDSWILAAYRGRINFESLNNELGKELTVEYKDELLNTHREALLKAIKSNSLASHYNWQAFLYLFAKLCVFSIATSSALVISNIFGAHVNTYAGLEGTAAIALKYTLGAVTFMGGFLANLITFRKSVPNVIRKLFEWDDVNGWHFVSRYEIKIYQNKNNEIKMGYEEQISDAKGPRKVYRQSAPQTDRFGWRSNIALLVQFSLSVLVGLVILAQTVDKASAGMKGLLPFMIGTGLPIVFAWTMGIAALVCMLGQYTYSMMDFLRRPDKMKEFRAVFLSVNAERTNVAEVYVHNFCMGVFALTLSFFVAMGIYGTSTVQAESFLTMIHAKQRAVSQLTVTILAIGGKAVFTVRALGNLIGLACATGAAVLAWAFTDKGYQSPIEKRDADDRISYWGLAAISIFAIAKSFTAVSPPEVVDTPETDISPTPEPISDLQSPNFETQFFAYSGIVGAATRAFQEPMTESKPDPSLLPKAKPAKTV